MEIYAGAFFALVFPATWHWRETRCSRTARGFRCHCMIKRDTASPRKMCINLKKVNGDSGSHRWIPPVQLLYKVATISRPKETQSFSLSYGVGEWLSNKCRVVHHENYCVITAVVAQYWLLVRVGYAKSAVAHETAWRSLLSKLFLGHELEPAYHLLCWRRCFHLAIRRV